MNADVNSLTAVLRSADCLRSLELAVRHKEKLDEVVHAIRLLTNLEALTVHVFRFIQTDLGPVTELQKLRYLQTGFPVMSNSGRELLFPSPTRLTHLHLRSVDEDEPHVSFSLQVSKSRRRISYLKKSIVLAYIDLCPYTAVAQTGSFPSGSGSVVGRRASLEGVLASVEPLGQPSFLSTKRRLFSSTPGYVSTDKAELRSQRGARPSRFSRVPALAHRTQIPHSPWQSSIDHSTRERGATPHDPDAAHGALFEALSNRLRPSLSDGNSVFHLLVFWKPPG